MARKKCCVCGKEMSSFSLNCLPLNIVVGNTRLVECRNCYNKHKGKTMECYPDGRVFMEGQQVAGFDLKPQLSPERRKKIAIIAVITTVLSILCLCFLMPGKHNSAGGYGSSLSDYYGHDKYDAIVVAEKQVKKQLKSSSTADFCSTSDYTVSCSGSTWTVKGYVDAQNSFGTYLRNYFTVVFKFSDSKNYTVISCNIN